MQHLERKGDLKLILKINVFIFAMVSMFVSPLNLSIEILMPDVIALGGGAFG